MIVLNEVGFLPKAKKQAVCFIQGQYVLKNQNGAVIKQLAATEFGKDPLSLDNCYCLDFSDIDMEGTYQIEELDSGDKSCTFIISKNAYDDVMKSLLKSFYYQRCGVALEEKYAGKFHHACCHTGLAKELHSGVKKEVSGGWHDAGDFGRYVTPAAVAVSHLLWGYELFAGKMPKVFHIPESGNGVDDLLNEVRVELEWMLKMQREDGAVYHKLTSFVHSDFVMPQEDLQEFLLFPVSTLATADFCGAMAQASIVYRTIDEAFADKMYEAAKRAYVWMREHEELIWEKNPQGCNTGEYDDTVDTDERFFAACELFYAGRKRNDRVVTKTVVQEYAKKLEELNAEGALTGEDAGKLFTGFGWREVSGLGAMRLLYEKGEGLEEELFQKIRMEFMKTADSYVALSKENAYGLAMSPEDFWWGSNMFVTNRGIVLAFASYISGDETYQKVAESHLDYILGKNALNISYVTGAGEHAFSHPHNRVTEADGIEETIPGFISGGPNKTPCDEKAVWLIRKGTPPMKCYVDMWECYSLNEITIYWNSSLVLMMLFLM